jgi:hypothetical protein
MPVLTSSFRSTQRGARFPFATFASDASGVDARDGELPSSNNAEPRASTYKDLVRRLLKNSRSHGDARKMPRHCFKKQGTFPANGWHVS